MLIGSDTTRQILSKRSLGVQLVVYAPQLRHSHMRIFELQHQVLTPVIGAPEYLYCCVAVASMHHRGELSPQ